MYIFWIYRILRTNLSLPFEIQNLPSYLLGIFLDPFLDYPGLFSWTLSILLAYGFLFYNFISVFLFLDIVFIFLKFIPYLHIFNFYHMYFYISM